MYFYKIKNISIEYYGITNICLNKTEFKNLLNLYPIISQKLIVVLHKCL